MDTFSLCQSSRRSTGCRQRHQLRTMASLSSADSTCPQPELNLAIIISGNRLGPWASHPHFIPPRILVTGPDIIWSAMLSNRFPLLQVSQIFISPFEWPTKYSHKLFHLEGKQVQYHLIPTILVNGEPKSITTYHFTVARPPPNFYRKRNW